MGRHNQRLGRRGEQLAADWYRAAGYRILDRNWRCADGEIDLVALGHGVVVFCEVKTRSSHRFGHPAEAVTPAKQHRIRRMGRRWLDAQPPPLRRARARYDVAAVVRSQVTVIRAAF